MTTTALQIRSLVPTLTVNDLKRSLKFYRDGLGFAVSEEMKDGGEVKGVMLDAGGFNLGIAQDDFAKGRDRVKGVGMRLYLETDQDVAVFEKIVDVEFVSIHRVVEFPGGTGDLRRKDQEQHDVGDVHFHGAFPQPFGGGEKMAAGDERTVDEAGKVAGNEHEELGGIAEPVIAQRQPGNDVLWNVIEKDHP